MKNDSTVYSGLRYLSEKKLFYMNLSFDGNCKDATKNLIKKYRRRKRQTLTFHFFIELKNGMTPE
jgi:hypothetical protein